jgi:1-acyl-sn-glycerol-3-phosphate acyltransferase
MKSDFRTVGKRELLCIPMFGRDLWLAGFMFIDRTDRAKGIQSLDRTVRMLRKGTSVVVFGEPVPTSSLTLESRDALIAAPSST